MQMNFGGTLLASLLNMPPVLIDSMKDLAERPNMIPIFYKKSTAYQVFKVKIISN
jgi:hypothetical protein